MQMSHEPMGQYVEQFAVAMEGEALLVVGLVEGQRVVIRFDAAEQAALLAILDVVP